MGITSLMKAYVGKDAFGGSWDEDLDNHISVYETLSRMFQVTKEEMHQSIPVMLRGDALSFFSDKMKGCTSYDDAINTLRRWYNSEEKRARILTAWQQLQLSE